MGNNSNSFVVFRIRLKFWLMILMGVKNNRTKYEPQINGGRRKRVLQMADLSFKGGASSAVRAQWNYLGVWPY